MEESTTNLADPIQRKDSSNSEAEKPRYGQASTGSQRFSIVLTILPLLLGSILTIGFQEFIAPDFTDDGFLHRLFLPPGSWYQAIVPYSIVFLFFSSVVDLFLKMLGTVNQRRSSRSRGIAVSVWRGSASTRPERVWRACSGTHSCLLAPMPSPH